MKHVKVPSTGPFFGQLWNTYLRAVLLNASTAECEVAKKAFYAGAAILQRFIAAALSEGPEITEQDFQLLSSVDREIREFLDAQGINLEVEEVTDGGVM